LTFLGHVTSSVTWPIDPPYVISYWCPIVTKPLSLTVFEILAPHIPCARARTHTHTQKHRHTPQVILYSVPCNVLHWTDNNTSLFADHCRGFYLRIYGMWISACLLLKLSSVCWTALPLHGRHIIMYCKQGWNCLGVDPPPPVLVYRRSFFEWKSASNFNPWAKFQTFRHLTPSSFRSIPTLTVKHSLIWCILA